MSGRTRERSATVFLFYAAFWNEALNDISVVCPRHASRFNFADVIQAAARRACRDNTHIICQYLWLHE